MVTINWLHDPLSKAVPIQAAQLTQARQAVESILGPQTWTDNPVTTSIPMKAVHFTELQARMRAVWNATGIPSSVPLLWTQSVPGASTPNVIRATQMDDLRRWFDTSQVGLANYQFPKVRPLIFGINPSWHSTASNYQDPSIQAQDNQMLAMVRQAGATCVRSGIDWATIEPSRGNRNFGLYDYRVNLALSNGLLWIANVGTAPSWAATVSSTQFMPVNDPTDYTNLVQATVQFFLGRIHHYECYNEPDGASWNYPSGVTTIQAKGASDAVWLQRFHDTVKANDSSAWVSVGGVGIAADLPATPDENDTGPMNSSLQPRPAFNTFAGFLKPTT